VYYSLTRALLIRAGDQASAADSAASNDDDDDDDDDDYDDDDDADDDDSKAQADYSPRHDKSDAFDYVRVQLPMGGHGDNIVKSPLTANQVWYSTHYYGITVQSVPELTQLS